MNHWQQKNCEHVKVPKVREDQVQPQNGHKTDSTAAPILFMRQLKKKNILCEHISNGNFFKFIYFLK